MIFIDTGAFLARYLVKDQHHGKAVAIWEELAAQREACATSNFVLDETLTLLGRWAGNRFAAQRAEKIYASKSIRRYRPDKKDELDALRLFVKYADQRVSFTDCISFTLMKREKIVRVFTFDRHFEYAGFQIIPS